MRGQRSVTFRWLFWTLWQYIRFGGAKYYEIVNAKLKKKITLIKFNNQTYYIQNANIHLIILMIKLLR
jgi:hypothetical protein